MGTSSERRGRRRRSCRGLGPLRRCPAGAMDRRQRKPVHDCPQQFRRRHLRFLPVTHSTSRTDAPGRKPEDASTPFLAACTTDLERLMSAKVDAWVFGHTHFAFDENINGTRVPARGASGGGMAAALKVCRSPEKGTHHEHHYVDRFDCSGCLAVWRWRRLLLEPAALTVSA